MHKFIFLFIVVVIILSCTAKESAQSPEFVIVHGKKQHVLDIGKGDPPVVFITGSGSWLEHFDSVQSAIAKVTRTISYDKPGIGKSEMIDEPRTLEAMTEQLKLILDAKDIKQPVILVGHSLGGMIARYFEIMYPDRVTGMVLVDPGDEYLWDDVRKVKSESWNRNLDSLYEVMKKDTTASAGQRAELEYSRQYDSVLLKVKTSSHIPVTLLESNKMVAEDLLDEEVIAIKKQGYRRLQREQMPHMKIISTEKSGHFIQITEPDLVIDAIREMIEKTALNQQPN